MSATLIFVYGTLKRGGRNHRHLAGQQFIASARTAPGFTLFQPADYPGLVRDPADQAGVTGEVWSVSDPCLRELDALEGVAEGLYTRVPVPLAPPHESLAAHSYLYLRSLAGCRRLGSTWTEPSSRR
ncbi:MAG: gamma-glutamylcyclotransferase [Opitutales bacterium]